MIDAIYWLIHNVIQLYILAMFIWIVLGWLLAFNVVNNSNQIVRSLYVGLGNLIEPALRPIRQFLPNLGGLDISPIILFLGLMFVDRLIYNILRPGPF